ncbi:hypothetical protein F1847_01605 [Thermodesulfobacterium sp. TA1]|uniref:hypothetical protein n=1 Tax=Thermodesulfobacterium sp. TA1 TaxID=2234087 RepID=UPI0012320132|nr:hypothetical protein [Thermodesulfobacterium sp. TA1]QER41496.1 hypothetical protein F1847_01605 [Thermodesulfobacterium sp. TA1]
MYRHLYRVLIFLGITGLFFGLIKDLANAETKKPQPKITTVSTSLKEKKEVVPNLLKLAIEISTQPLPKEVDVINLLGAIDKKIKGLGLNYQGGRYNLYKHCQWIENQQICDGYKGNLSYLFELKDLNDQTKVYSLLNEVKKDYGNTFEFSVTNSYWSIAEKDLEAVIEGLKLNLITKAMKFAEKVSNTLNKTCYITTLNLDQRNEGIIIQKAFSLKSFPEEKEKIEAPSPKREQTIEVSAYVVLSCF